jgi:hypothetical protein
MLGKALYYPHIDIRDPKWLRSAVLFWDEIQSIVPPSISEPYHTNVPTHSFGTRGDVFFQRLPAACILL